MRSGEERLSAYLDSGMRAHAQGDLDAAAVAYQRALAVAPDNPDALNLLGTALLQLGQAERALDCLRRAARRLRDNPGVMGNLGHAYFALGRFEEAREAFRKASRLDPRQMQFQLGVATSLAMQGELEDAEAFLRRLVSRFPHEALAWFNLGNVIRDRGRHAEAIEPYRKALALDPRFVDAGNNLAGVLHALERYEEAEREYRACIDMAPDHLLAKLNLASLTIDLGRCSEAEALCREAIVLAPGKGEAHTLLGAALGHQARILEALACHRKVVEISPRDQKAVEIYAGALSDAGFFSEAWRWFSRALSANPDSIGARQGLYFALLAAGRLADGWAEYHYRPPALRLREKHSALGVSPVLPAEVKGRHLCFLREQGLGDEVFFLRFAPQLHAAGARISYRASNKIRGLFTRVDWIDEVLAEDEPLPEADAVLLIGDLPHALSGFPASVLPRAAVAQDGFSLRDFPCRIAVFWPPVAPSIELRPVGEKMAQVRERLARAGGPPFLGVTWRGGTPPREQGAEAWKLYKEIAIPLLAEALNDFPGTFIGLQRKPAPGELDRLSGALGRPVHDFTDLNEDLEGMLALLALIDEYVGVSNTNMHLRAAAGKTARVLVPCPAEWRWMAWGRSSPWFRGFSIYRQTLTGEWRTALAALARDLARAGR